MFVRIIGNYLKYLANYTPVSTWINPIFETGNILEFKFKNFSFKFVVFFSRNNSEQTFLWILFSFFIFLTAGCSRIWFKLIASGFIQDIFDAAVYFSNHHIRILFFWTKQFFLFFYVKTFKFTLLVSLKMNNEATIQNISSISILFFHLFFFGGGFFSVQAPLCIIYCTC